MRVGSSLWPTCRCRAVRSSVWWMPSRPVPRGSGDVGLTGRTLFRRSWTFWSPPRRSTPTPPGPGRLLRSRRVARGGRDVGDARAHAARTAPLAYSAIDLPEMGLEPQVLRPCVVGSGILLRRPTTRSTSICCARPVRDGWRSTARRPRSTTVACAGGSGEWRGCTCGCSRGLRPAEPVVLVTTTVVRDTPPDRHFSAWSRPKPAPDPLPGPSVASGVIPTKGGRNGPVPATSGRASTGRWRSSPWKRCKHAAPRGRVREHPAPLGALRL